MCKCFVECDFLSNGTVLLKVTSAFLNLSEKLRKDRGSNMSAGLRSSCSTLIQLPAHMSEKQKRMAQVLVP